MCKEIDKIQRNFIWGSEGERKKLHWVSWANMCKRKKFGGLGLRETTIVNEAYMAKLGWNVLTAPNLLWVRVLNVKYFHHDLLNYSTKSSDSTICRGILKGRELLNKGL
ncbi:uncharacterized protein LOC128071179 [Budorcas taxicolor]|uniref:uncharacterized protein LOC128071179 n=1 Tax=Budorcas taxicolor TaxID=37181 RepID=UPI0022835786|nr:uncharacterized protein LOC128071179 [Budorcas taxicolor]